MIPARLTSTGKRTPRYFATRAQAQAFAAAMASSATSMGTDALSITPAALTEAAEARALLQATLPGVSLLQAVRMAITAANGTSPITNPEGRGEQENVKSQGPASPTLLAALAAYQDAKGHQSSRTTAERAGKLATLLRRNPGLETATMDQLSASDIQHALETAWPTQPAAYNDALKHLGTIYAWHLKKGLCLHNPIPSIDKRHAKEAEIRALTPTELTALFLACRPPHPHEITAHGNTHQARLQHADTTDLRLYIALGALAGIRPDEIPRLTWQDIDLEDNIISVRAKNSKTGGARHIELHPTLRAWLTTYRPATATPTATIICTPDLANKKKALLRRAGYSPSNPWPQDALRHSYATYYLKAGGNIHALQLNMGHRDAHLLYTRYTNMAGVTKATAAAWWATTPATVAESPE